MQKNDELQRVLLESIREAIFILDGQGTFRFMNTSAADQVGGRPEDFVGKSVRDIFPAELAAGFVASVRQVLESRTGTTVVTQQPLREGLRWHRTQLEPLRDADGQVTTVLLIAKDITDWKHAEDARAETESKYRMLVEQIPAITYTAPLDQTNGVLFISPQITELLGFTLEECRNDPDLWQRRLHPDDRDRVLGELARSRRDAHRFICEYRLTAKDGRIKWFHDEAQFVRAADGRPSHQHGVMLDITGQKVAQEAARRTDELFHQLFDCSPIGMTIHDSRGRLLNVNRAAREILGLPEVRQNLNFELLSDPQLPVEARTRLLAGQSARFEAVYDFDRVRRERLHDTIRTGCARLDTLMTPLTDDHTGKRTGYLVQIQDITEKTSAQDAARRAEDTFRKLFDCSPISMFLFDARGQLVNANRAALELTGMTNLQVHPQYGLLADPQMPADAPARLLAGESVRFETVYDFDVVRKAGFYETSKTGMAQVDAVITPLPGNAGDTCGGYLVQAQDITERKRADSHVARLSTQRQLALDAAQMGWWHYDPYTRIVSWDERYRSLLDLEGHQGLDELIFARVHPDDVPLLQAALGDALGDTRPPTTSLEFRIRLSNGRERWVEAFGNAAAERADDTNRVLGLYGTVRDITERKQREAQLAQLSVQRQLALHATRMGWWHYDLATERFTWDDRVQAIFELQGQEASRAAILARVHPDDLPRVEAGAQIVLGNPDPQPHTVEFRIRLPNGSERCVENVTIALYEGIGVSRRPVGLFGTSRDITERKRIENALRESRQEFADLLESLEDGVWAAQPDGRYLYLNPAMERIYGRPPAELLADPELWLKVVHPEDALRARESRQKLLQDGRADLEYRILRPDGTVRWIRDRKSAVRDSEGRSLRIGGIIRDITNRMESNRQAEQYRTHLKSLATALTLTEERERRRLAANIHDDLVQILGLIQIKLADLKTSFRGGNKTALEEIEGLVDRSVRSSRSLTLQLSPPVLYDLGFTAAAEWLAEDMKALYGLAISVAERGQGPQLDEPRRVVLFQCLREALVNVAKHAGIPAARVRIHRGRSTVRVAVQDRGVGFDPLEVGRHASQHFGLFSIRERLEPMGGHLAVHSAPGKGTTVVMRIPFSNPEVPLAEMTP
jgi:PAS domain S-box-containing protein